MRNTSQNAVPDLLTGALGAAVDHILANEDPQQFLRWFTDEIATRASESSEIFESRSEITAFASSFGRAIWNATPLPGNGFRPGPLPAPGRNDPCPCASGRKFKKCCGHGPPPPPLDSQILWPLVLERLSGRGRQDAIDSGRAPVAALIGAALELIESGRPKKALVFVQPLFDGEIRGHDDHYEFALDLVCDLYDELGYSTKKLKLLQRVTQEVERSPLRSGAWQRLAAMSIDQGAAERAWQCFQSAQRDDPDAPSLGILEVQILTAEGKRSQASERARYWAKRLQGQGWPGDDGPVAFLRAVAQDPGQAMAQIGVGMAGGAGKRLLAWLGQVAGRAIPQYKMTRDPPGLPADGADDWRSALVSRLRGLGLSEDQLQEAIADLPPPGEGDDPEADGIGLQSDDTGILTPPAPIESLQAAWHEVFPLSKPFSVGMLPPDGSDPWDPPVEDQWMDFLESNPAAFDSLDILDDLVAAVLDHEMVEMPGFDESLLAPLLHRAKAIIDAATAGYVDVRLAWFCLDNRPALRCLVHLVFLEERQGNQAAASDLAQRMLALNPNDNHGLRTMVVNQLLRSGQDEHAVTLAEQYPDDMNPDISYGRALALFRLDRRVEARAALHEAIAELPKVARFLTAGRVRRPNIDPHGVRIGGDDQAWLYREAMRDVWKATPAALEWLKKIASSGTK